MGEKGHNTNLAAEYHVLSMLYRIGADAYLTLGNKKSIDIVVDVGGKTMTVDVKGLKDTSCFPIDNWNRKEETHYLIFVSFLKKIDVPECLPETYIVPSLDVDKKQRELAGKTIVYRNPKGNRMVVQLSRLRKLKYKYLDKWDCFKS